MEVPQLHNLAFIANIQYLWRTSDIPAIMTNFIYQKDRKNDECQETNARIKIALQNILEGYLANVPFRLKYALIAGVSGLTSDISVFADELTDGHQKQLKRSIRFCLNNILLNETGGIDHQKSILNIIKKSNLDIQFKILFLAKHCVKGSALRNVLHEVANLQLANIKSTRDRACKRKSTKYMARKLKNSDYLGMLYSGLKGVDYWSTQKRFAKFDDMAIQHVADFQYVSVYANVQVIEYYYKKLSKRIDPEELHSDTLDAAKYMFLNNCFDESKIMFFYQNLRSDSWLKLLQCNASGIIVSLLFSWRYRHFCPAFFRDCMCQFTVQKCRSLFYDVLEHCKQEMFQYYDLMSVLQRMWLDMPTEFQEDYEVSQILIPKILTLKSDVESLIHFTSCYDIELQKNVIAQYIFSLINTDKCDVIENCLLSLKLQRGLAVDVKDLLTIDRFKFFLVYNIVNFDGLDAVSNAMCDTGVEKTELKHSLLNDKEFLSELLVNARAEKNMNDYLKWVFESDKLSKKFRKSLLSGGFISDVYDRRIIENEKLKVADEIFKALKCTPAETQYIADRVKDNELVLKMYATSMMETQQFSNIQKIFATLADAQSFMKSFLLSDEGKSLLFDTLVNVPIVESCSSFKFKYSNYTKLLFEFCNNFITPCNIKNEMVEWIDSVNSFGKDQVKVGRVPIGMVTTDPQEIVVAHGIAREQMLSFRNFLSRPHPHTVHIYLNDMADIFDMVGMFFF